MNNALGLPPLENIAKSKLRVKTRIVHVTGLITSGIKARFEEPFVDLSLPMGKSIPGADTTIDPIQPVKGRAAY